MEKIVNIETAIKIAQTVKREGKRIVLAGGCFDILHIGHVRFLQESKKHGTHLFVLVESDQQVRTLKGDNRPIFMQADRALVLASLAFVDFVILLPDSFTDKDYDTLVFTLKPAIIATTKNDPGKNHKIRQAQAIQATVIEVIDRIDAVSTSKLAKSLFDEKNI